MALEKQSPAAASPGAAVDTGARIPPIAGPKMKPSPNAAPMSPMLPAR